MNDTYYSLLLHKIMKFNTVLFQVTVEEQNINGKGSKKCPQMRKMKNDGNFISVFQGLIRVCNCYILHWRPKFVTMIFEPKTE